MKNLKIIVLSFICIFVINCSENSETTSNEDTLTGKWMLVETYVTYGANGEWIGDFMPAPEELIYSYTLNNDGTFTSTKFEDCQSGNYTFSSSEIIFDFECEGFTAGIENPPGTFKENYTFDNRNLILTPQYLLCVEGCGWKFVKVIEQ